MKREARQYLARQRKVSRWHKVVTVLAGIVVFCTTYALILPAITMTTPLACGMEEHIHTDECYAVETIAGEGELVCGLEEAEGHTHDESCYTEEIHYLCGLEESEGHSHGEECYTLTRGELICEREFDTVEKQVEKLVEREITDENGEAVTVEETVTETVTEEVPHVHTDECCAWTRELTCTLEETEGHTHGEECGVETEQVLSCTLEETEGHSHSDACWSIPEDRGEDQEVRTLVCGKEEHIHDDNCYLELDLEEIEFYCGFLTEHTHDESCYFEDGVLKCTIPEHVHEEACLIPPIMTLEENGEEYQEYDIIAEGIGSVVLSHTDGLLLGPGEEVDPDKTYLLTLNINSSEGLQPNARYIYQLPAGVVAGTDARTELRLGADLIGEWWVDENGRVIVETNQQVSKYQNVEIKSPVEIGFDKNAEQIEFDGGIKVNVKQEAEKAPITMNKWETDGKNGGTGNTDSHTIEWLVQIWKNGDEPIVGATLTDQRMESWPTEQYGYTYTEADKARGIRVYCYFGYNGWEEHWFTISEKDCIQWTDTGWSFQVPDMKVHCENHPDAADDEAYLKDALALQLVYTSTIPEDAEGVVGNQNCISFTPAGEKEPTAAAKGWSEHRFAGEGKSRIEKDSVYDAETDTITWTIRATVYANPGEDGDYPNVTLGDQMAIADAALNVVKTDGEGNPITDLNIQDLSKLKIQAVIGGVEYEVPYIDMNDPNAAWVQIQEMYNKGVPLACTGGIKQSISVPGTLNDSWYLEFWSLCKCKEGHCHNWANGGCQDAAFGYCRCWDLEGAVELTVTYETYVGDTVLSEDPATGEKKVQAGLRNTFAGNDIYNQAILQEELRSGKKIMNSQTHQRLKSSFAKSLTEIPQAGNNYTAQFNITVNEAKKDLSDQDAVEILDQMSDNLVFMPQTLVVSAEDLEGNTRVLQPDTDYKVSYDGEKHLLSITLKKPGSFMYTLDYDTAVTFTSGNTFKYFNTAKIELNGVKYESKVEPMESAITTVCGESYSITLYKDNIKGDRLPGAVFGLYARNGNLIDKVTTNEEGVAEIRTSTTQGIMFYIHTPYYIQEITAPAGYQLDESKHWFVFCGKEEGACEECEKLREELGVEISREFKDGSMEIVNYGAPTLPATGGMGLTVWYALGGTLLLSGACLVYKKKAWETGREDA